MSFAITLARRHDSKKFEIVVNSDKTVTEHLVQWRGFRVLSAHPQFAEAMVVDSNRGQLCHRTFQRSAAVQCAPVSVQPSPVKQPAAAGLPVAVVGPAGVVAVAGGSGGGIADILPPAEVANEVAAEQPELLNERPAKRRK